MSWVYIPNQTNLTYLEDMAYIKSYSLTALTVKTHLNEYEKIKQLKSTTMSWKGKTEIISPLLMGKQWKINWELMSLEMRTNKQKYFWILKISYPNEISKISTKGENIVDLVFISKQESMNNSSVISIAHSDHIITEITCKM